MKFHQLDIENFLTLKKASFNLADRGLQLIQGANDDDSSASSNGAGKSSVVDAICWCLYGVTARDVKGDAVVNLGAKKGCMVSLVIESGSTRYRVIRHRKHATHKNALIVEVARGEPSDGTTDLSRGTDVETQKVLEKILGCSHAVFMAAVYSGQEAMPDLPKMKDRELKTLIEEAAGLQRIERAYEVSRERMNTAKNRVTVALNAVSSLRANKASADLSLLDMEDQHKSWEGARTERVEESQGCVVRASVASFDACALRDKLKPGAAWADTRIKEIDTLLGTHKVLERIASDADRRVRAAELAIDAGALKRLAAEIEKHKGRIANAAEEIKKPCTQCGTVLESMSIEDFVAHETKHLDASVLRLEEAKAHARTQVAELTKERAAAATARAEVPDVTELTAERARAVAVYKEWEQAAFGADRAADALTAAKTQLALRESEPNPKESALNLCREQLTKVVEQLAAAETTLKTDSGQLEVATAVVKVFGPAGVRAQILDTVTPFLNARTSDYLSALSDGEISAQWTTLTKSASGDLKEKFSIDVTHAKGGDSFAALSGGEKRKVRLATALGLQDLMASRASQPIDLWCGDEVDDALDPAGLERLMTILERKARERGTVLVISHSDLKDWCDNVTTVRKTELWSSSAEGALCS